MSAVASPVLDSPRPMTSAQLDQLSINCIRTLSIDAVQQAKSGHPGTPMALAPLIYTLWQPGVPLADVRHFRHLASKAPGHPEYHLVSGVEATTGPLGQGVATSVGMAVAQNWLANHYNRSAFNIFDYNIYAVCGDACLMEGIGSEAASFAAHLGLDNLCWIYDNNHITI